MAIILIVDDEEPMRRFLAQLLTEGGYQVRVARHGGEALQLVDKEPPDLVLSDVMMPVLNGRELLERLKAREDTKDIPVILISAAGSRAADRANADAFLDKPFDIDDLEALVRRFLPPEEHAP